MGRNPEVRRAGIKSGQFTLLFKHSKSLRNWRQEMLYTCPVAYSEPNRPPIPTQIGHLFRSKPATVTEQIGHPLGDRLN
jgi:hypothetical protein